MKRYKVYVYNTVDKFWDCYEVLAEDPVDARNVAVQFAAENDSEWEGYRVVLTFPELYEPLGGVVGMSIVVVKEEP